MLRERLKQLRLSHGYTQQDIASALNISRSAYALYESGKRQLNYGSLAALADFYAVSLDYLFGRTDDPEPPGERGPEERVLLSRYRTLDQRGRETVRAVAELEQRMRK